MKLKASLMVTVAGTSLTLLSGGAAFAQVAGGAPPATGPATNTTNSAGIADIIVTARKREESAQRIPVAVTNLNSQAIAQKGITKAEDLGRFVPGLIFRDGGNSVSANFAIRGQVSSDVILTIAPAIGIYEDNGNIGHPVALNSAFFDIERVETLKGPQGTLYGRNTTGGAINIITRGADFDGEHGFVMAEIGNYASRRIAGGFNVSLIDDKLAFRIVGQHWTRDGFGRSLQTGQRFGNDRNDDGLRASVLFKPTDTITSKTKLEYVKIDRGGLFQRLKAIPPGSTAATEVGLESGCATSIANITPPSATRPNPLFNLSTALAFSGCANAAISRITGSTDIFTSYSDVQNAERAQSWHAVEDLSIDLSDNVTLRSITAFHSAKSIILQDADGSPFRIIEFYAGIGGYQSGARYVSDGVNPIPGGTTVLPKGTGVSFPFQYPLPVQPNISYHQFSQEFNLTGKSMDNRLNWLIGAFALRDSGRGTEPALAFDVLTGGGINNTGNTPSIVSKSWGIFTQEDFRFTDQLSVTGGLRYSREYQDLRSQPFNWSATTGNFTCVSVPPAPNVPAPNNDSAACGFVYNKLRSHGVSYLASINYQATPDVLLYAKTSRGFRGGALQLRAAYLPGSQPETATDYELGLKSDFFDRRVRFNLAAYHTDLKNKQESIIVPVCNDPTNPNCAATQSIIFNAASARVNGFEAELMTVPVRGLTLGATLALADNKYRRFPNAPNQNSRTGGTFDASGLPTREPRWQYTISGRYEHEVGPGVASASLDWSWLSRTHVTQLNFPTAVFSADLLNELTRSRGLLSGRIDYNLRDQGLVFALSATNLLNNKYETYGLFSQSLGIGASHPAEARMAVFSITKKFGPE